MNNNNQLTYVKNKKISSKNILLIILLVITIVLLITILAYFFLVYNTPTNKIKRYLTKQEYSCTKNVCIKKTSTDKITISLKDGHLEASNNLYEFYLSETTKSLNIKKTQKVCYYAKENSTAFSTVDDTYTYDLQCEQYIKNVNEYIDTYKKIFTTTKVNVNDLKK